MSLATCTIVGRVGRDPETKTTPGGKTVTTFSVGVDQGFGESKTTGWYDVVAWDKLADSIPKFVKKGALVAIHGRLQVRSWDDKDTGKKVYKTEVIAEGVQRLDTRSESTGEPAAQTNRQAAKPAARTTTTPAPRASTPIEDGTYISDDDIPF
jgi:single-strand DNA-binding protein